MTGNLTRKLCNNKPKSIYYAWKGIGSVREYLILDQELNSQVGTIHYLHYLEWLLSGKRSFNDHSFLAWTLTKMNKNLTKMNKNQPTSYIFKQ